ncbi:MAG: preprotein translocase subunit SecE [Anaerolineae bacterium]|nr:MAG: preprotein translocase subunit SecE [Anaerolineae bacterium]
MIPKHAVLAARRRFRRKKEICVAKKKKTARGNALVRYYRETVGELRKVTWPTRQEAVNLTIIVLIVTFGMSAFLGVLDYLFTRLFALIF